MFTGLIEDMGTVRELSRDNSRVRLTVGTAIPTGELHIGDSVAINGICLTVVAAGNGTFSADVSPETLDCSTLGELSAGSRVNLERALRLSDRLGGHLVSGHVDAVATICERRQDGNAVRFAFCLPAEVNRLIAEKGSVAIDGISLTVNAVTDETFEVAVIPHTLVETTLHEKKSGDRVNIETDLIARYIARLLGMAGAKTKEPLSFDFLAKHGFL